MFVKYFTSCCHTVKRIADSTVRRLSMYLRYLEDLDTRGQKTASSDELAQLCGTTASIRSLEKIPWIFLYILPQYPCKFCVIS